MQRILQYLREILKLTKHYFIFTGEVEAGGNNIQNRQRNTATLGLVVHAAGT